MKPDRYGALVLFLGAIPSLKAIEELPPLIVEAELEERARTPGNVTLIERPEVEKGDSVADLLEKKAGLPMQSFFGTAGLGSPVLRGFAEGGSSRTLILLDGVPVSRPDMASAPWFQFPVAGLERIEVLRGSRTVRYGSGALGGVIALETRIGEEFGGSVEARAGSFGQETLRGSLTSPLGDWGFSANLENNSADGYRDNSAYRSLAWGAVVRSPEGRPFEARWSFGGSNLTFENPGPLSNERYRRNPRQSIYEEFGVADQYVSEIDQFRIGQSLKWSVNDTLSVEFAGAWQRRERALNFGAGSHTDQALDGWSGELVVSGGERLSWQVGVRARQDDLDLTRYRERERLRLSGEAALLRQTLGVFVLTRFDLTDHWALTGGVSWDRWDLSANSRDFDLRGNPDGGLSGDRSEDGWAGELGLEYERDQFKAWARYDRVIRFPVMDEVAAYQGFLLADPFNADLRPERGHSFEIGSSYSAEDWRWKSAFFSQWLEGEIGFDFRENNNVNFADTRRYGIENELNWTTDHWSASFIHSFTIAEYRSGDFSGKRVPLVPESVVSLSLDWHPTDELTLTLGGRYLGNSPEGNDFANDQPDLPSRFLMDAGMSWRPADGTEFFLRIDNLLDRDHATLKYQGQWYPGAGRQVSVGGRWTF